MNKFLRSIMFGFFRALLPISLLLAVFLSPSMLWQPWQILVAASKMWDEPWW